MVSSSWEAILRGGGRVAARSLITANNTDYGYKETAVKNGESTVSSCLGNISNKEDLWFLSRLRLRIENKERSKMILNS